MASLDLKRFLNNTITIYRRSTEGDDFGGVTSEWDKKNWNVVCRIYGTRGQPFTFSVEGKNYIVSMKMMCDKFVDIKVGDKVKEDKAGQTYMVVFLKAARTHQKVHHLEGLLSRIDI